MGNEEEINEKKKQKLKNFMNSFSSEKIFPKKIDNRFLKKNIKKSDLTQEEIEILNCLSKPKDAYYCSYCVSFPLIAYSVVRDPRHQFDPKKKEMVQLTLIEHSWGVDRTKHSISHNFRDDELTHALRVYSKRYIAEDIIHDIIKDKYVADFPDDLLPFESLDDFHEFLSVVIKYKGLKEKISFYNLGDTKKNYVFNFFEFILNMGLYGFGTLYEYLNALALKDFLNFETLEQYNCGEHMENEDIIYETKSYDLKQVTNIIKLNDDNLIAFLIDVNYKFTSYKNNIVGIFFEKFDIKSYFNSSISYLMHKETDKPKKNVIIKYNDYNYKNIIELETDKYLILLDIYSIANLLIVTYNDNYKNYDYTALNDWICISFIKLKSKQIFLVCKSSLYLMSYEYYELKILKKYEYKLTPQKGYNYLIKELLNGDIIFSVEPNKFIYFNMKYFMIQTIIEKKSNNNISSFNQLNDKNYFYFFVSKKPYEFNIRNGRIKALQYPDNKAESTFLGGYYLDGDNKSLHVRDENYKLIYMKRLYEKSKIFIIDEKENIFATMGFNIHTYSMYIKVFKIYKINNK